jgi:hypothetical protein
MKQISKYTLAVIRNHKEAKTGWPIWKLMPISKCWIGLPKIQYVIWWGKSILDYADNYKDAVKRRREIYNLA